MDARVARSRAEIVRILQAQEHVENVLQDIVTAAMHNVAGAEHVGITAGSALALTTPAASGPLAEKLNAMQYSVGEGPCLDAAQRHTVVQSDDLANDTRWPQFASAATEMGVRSVLAIPVFVQGDRFGALAHYSSRAGAFDAESESIASLMASHAAIAMVGARTEVELRAALTTRDIIGQAKGILMERHKVSGDEAFSLLVRASQATQRKLREVADLVVATGQDPVEPVGRGADSRREDYFGR